MGLPASVLPPHIVNAALPPLVERLLHIPDEQSPIDDVRRRMFVDFFACLEERGIRYVILAGYEGYPDRIDSDVDFMVSPADFHRLREMFRDTRCIPGARLVQVLRHETTACYYVFARQVGSRMAYLHADATSDYRRGGRLWLESERALSSRRLSVAGFWIPAPAIEFEYYLVKRLDKGTIERIHLERLAARLSEAPEACRQALRRVFSGTLADRAADAITGTDLDWFAQENESLRSALARSLHGERLVGRIRAGLGEVRRRWHRITVPSGFVVAVLGPDGSGKTTVIEHLVREFGPAFRRTRRFHLRPHFGRASGRAACTDPHGGQPRSRLSCFAKLLYFLADYWTGWVALVIPMRMRSSLVVFDRYFHDALVDPARYRLPGAFHVAHRIAPLIPKPDLWLVLHASAPELLDRKREVKESTATVLVEAYCALAKTLPYSALIDTSGSLDDALQRTVRVVRCALEERERGRLRAHLRV